MLVRKSQRRKGSQGTPFASV